MIGLKQFFRLVSILTLVLLALAPWNPQPVHADGKSCSWSPGINDYEWGNGENWACSEGQGPPDQDTEVNLSAASAIAPIVTGPDNKAKVLTISGWLKIGAGSSLFVKEGWSNTGEATIDSQGTIVGDGEVGAFGTFHFLSSGTIEGKLTVDSLATASVDRLYVKGDVTVQSYARIQGESEDAQFHMLGPLFTNDGTVSTNEFFFERGIDGAVSEIQEATGSGAWDSGTDHLFIKNHTHLLADSDLNFGPHYFDITDDDGVLDVRTHQVTFAAPTTVLDSGSIVGSAGGSVHTRSDKTLSDVWIQVPHEAIFQPPLVVESGVTHAFGPFNGPITVEQEGSLTVMALPEGVLTARETVTIDGVLNGDDVDVRFVMQGQHLAVNGLISVAELDLQGPVQQRIDGASTDGIAVSNLVVDTPGGAILEVPLFLSGTLGLNADLFAGEDALVTLGETATTTSSTPGTDVFGTVKRSGTFVKDKTYSFGNPNLTLTFYDEGSGLPSSVTLKLARDPWKDLRGSIQRSYSFSTSGGSGWTASLTLDYRHSELSGPDQYLQAWTRASGSTPWSQSPVPFADLTGNWLRLNGLTRLSDWGLVTHAQYLPFLRAK